MSTNPTSTYQVNIDVSLATGDVVTFNVTPPAMFVIANSSFGDGFSLVPEQVSNPLSLGQMSLSSGSLSLTAGAAQLASTIVVNVQVPQGTGFVGGVTTTSDTSLSASAVVVANGFHTNLIGDWTLQVPIQARAPTSSDTVPA